MSEHEYRQLVRQASHALRRHGNPLPPRATVDYLVDESLADLSTARAVVSDLILDGKLRVTEDLRLEFAG